MTTRKTQGTKVPDNQAAGSMTAERHGSWHIWWRLLRPHTLTASVIPVLVGTAAAFRQGHIDYLLFSSMLLASMLIQSATNMFNEYYDYKRGLDNADSVGIGGAIVRHGVKTGTVFNLAVVFCLFALLTGIYISARSTWWLIPIGAVCVLAGYLYTGGPYPIAYTPFGELMAGFFMGTVIILISFYIQTGHLSTYAVLLAVPQSVLIGAILMANNIRDLDGDRAKGRRTLAILAGRTGAIRWLTAMFAFSYLWIVALLFLRLITPWLSLAFLSIPVAVRAVQGFKDNLTPARMMPAMQATAQTNTLFGLAVVLAVVLRVITVGRL